MCIRDSVPEAAFVFSLLFFFQATFGTSAGVQGGTTQDNSIALVPGSGMAVPDRPQGSGSAAEVAQAVGEGMLSGPFHGPATHGATSSGESCSS